jgi:hypothetical protein
LAERLHETLDVHWSLLQPGLDLVRQREQLATVDVGPYLPSESFEWDLLTVQ